MSLPLIASRAFNTPLLMHPGKALAMVSALGGRFLGAGVDVVGGEPAVDHVAFAGGRATLGRVGDPMGRILDARGLLPFAVIDGVAVIPIEGTLVHKGAFVGQSSGQTSFQGLQTQIARAGRSDQVRGVVFEVDSFGGEMAGAFETADMIARLSEVKPTIAILTDFALSAGYLMAAAARTIIAPEFGRAGSIGVITMHVDHSRQLEQEGVRVTIIAAGKHKADGNPFQALPASLAERLRGEVEEARQVFAAVIGRFRGQRLTAAQALATEADDFRAREALDLGLIDGIGAANEAFGAFVSEINRR